MSNLNWNLKIDKILLTSLGPDHLQVNTKSLKSQGLFQISKRPGPGACVYTNCNHYHKTFLSGITLKSLHV